MALAVKFRSAKELYTVRIDDEKPTISLQNLRIKLATLVKGFPVTDDHNRDFQLLFYDAVSGEEFDEHNPEIQSGTAVYIKRVPLSSITEDTNALDKFLTDFPPVPEWTPSLPPPQNNVPRRVREADHHPELRCQLCGNYLKEAMTIICCHETFCKECVLRELRTGKCPTCDLVSSRSTRQVIPNLYVRSLVELYVDSRNVPDEGSIITNVVKKYRQGNKRKKHENGEAQASSKDKARKTNDANSTPAGIYVQHGQNHHQGNFHGWNHFTGGQPMHQSGYGYPYWAAPVRGYWNPFYGFWQGMCPSNYPSTSTSTSPFPYPAFWGQMCISNPYFSSPDFTTTSEEHMDSERKGKKAF